MDQITYVLKTDSNVWKFLVYWSDADQVGDPKPSRAIALSVGAEENIIGLFDDGVYVKPGLEASTVLKYQFIAINVPAFTMNDILSSRTSIRVTRHRNQALFSNYGRMKFDVQSTDESINKLYVFPKVFEEIVHSTVHEMVNRTSARERIDVREKMERAHNAFVVGGGEITRETVTW